MTPDFVQIGDVHLRRSNIVAFGIATGARDEGLLEAGFWRFVLGSIVVASGKPRPKGKYRYLFVTTNENQNYQFPEDEIDIEAALAELERMA